MIADFPAPLALLAGAVDSAQPHLCRAFAIVEARIRTRHFRYASTIYAFQSDSLATIFIDVNVIITKEMRYSERVNC